MQGKKEIYNLLWYEPYKIGHWVGFKDLTLLHNEWLRSFLYADIKISTYLKAAWHSVEWLDDTDPDYMNQILDYSEFAEHDDAPDSAACLIRKYNTKSKYNSVKGGI